MDALGKKWHPSIRFSEDLHKPHIQFQLAKSINTKEHTLNPANKT